MRQTFVSPTMEMLQLSENVLNSFLPHIKCLRVQVHFLTSKDSLNLVIHREGLSNTKQQDW